MERQKQNLKKVKNTVDNGENSFKLTYNINKTRWSKQTNQRNNRRPPKARTCKLPFDKQILHYNLVHTCLYYIHMKLKTIVTFTTMMESDIFYSFFFYWEQNKTSKNPQVEI